MELERRWGEVVGPQLAMVSRPARVEKGTLTIWATEAVWVNSMLFLRSEIRSKVNAMFRGPEVEQVMIVQNNKVAIPSSRVDRNPPAEEKPLTEPERMEMENALSSVSDSQLCSTFKRVILRSIGKKGRD